MNIEELRAFCLTLPHTTEDIKWSSDLCFCINDKMYCVTELNSEPLSVSFKVKPEEFEELIEREFFEPAKYVARYKWVTLMDSRQIDVPELKTLVKGSYNLINKKK